MMNSFLLAILLIWVPLIPLRLAIQAGVKAWRRMGEFSSLVFFVYWVAVDAVVLNRQGEWALPAVESTPVLSAAGLLLMAAAGGLAAWTAGTLGFKTLFLRPQLAPGKATTPLIIQGPYRFLRHPFYFSEWFFLAGACFVTGSWLILGLLVAAILLDPVVTLFEEKELLERFGEEYRAYQKKVPRLLPTLAPLLAKGGI